jgi:cytochrome c-type biogenesis protein CcmF
MRSWIGEIGHLLVIISFVTAITAAVAYWLMERATEAEKPLWRGFARLIYNLHGLSVLGVILVLFLIIYNHYYEYHYAWSHASNNLPIEYMISCFWEGQEGSFLLWIFWHVLVGWALIRRAGKWEAPVMATFAAVQAFLASMILGIIIPFVGIKIGSSPFILLKDAMPDAPIFQANPNFIPEDGTGLNPLLQNYWMVIHPPTLFLGFALTLVPFAFCIAALVQGKTREWIKPALSWTLMAAAVLGVGILMGAYWAYETLNFGGYWNWDPVENAVYIPWLTLVASLHLMVSESRRPAMARSAAVMVVITFILILYSTFLTRSGVLGDTSVHSFTDLGLSGQLLLYLLFFSGLGIVLLALNWSKFPQAKEKDLKYNTGEFWLFIAALVLSLSALQVLLPTSVPVLNTILNFFGAESNLAPPAEPTLFYTQWQLWFGVMMALGAAMGQFYWWKQGRRKISEALTLPLALTLILSALLIALLEVQKPEYIILLTVALFTLFSNLTTILRLVLKKDFILWGGALSHVGVGLMLLGALFSSAFEKVVSLNTTGFLYSKEFSEETNRENLLLFRNQPQKMENYLLTFKGRRVESEDVPFLLDVEKLSPTANPYRMVAKQDILQNGQVKVKKHDTLQVYFENTYYEIEYKNPEGETFSLYPRVQRNEEMGNGFVVSPDIVQGFRKDLYTHITTIPDPDQERKWTSIDTLNLAVGDTFVLNDFIAVFKGMVQGTPIADEDLIFYAQIEVMDRENQYLIEPAYQIKGTFARGLPEFNETAASELTLLKIDPQAGLFTFKVRTTQKDWVILKAIEKPYISLFWAGSLLMTFGFGLAFWRRLSNRTPNAPPDKDPSPKTDRPILSDISK